MTPARKLTGSAELLSHPYPLWAVADGDGARLMRADGMTAPPGAVAWVPAVVAESLGDAHFRNAHGLRFAYIAGDMAGGISGPELVANIAAGGMLGFFGAGGVELEKIGDALDDIRRRLPDGRAFGANLLHSPVTPQKEMTTAKLYVRKGVGRVSASGYVALTPAVVYARLSGVRRGPDGAPVARHLFAKVSQSKVAEEFLQPPPPAMVQALVRSGDLTAEEGELGANVPVADHVTGEGDSAGHTDNQATMPLLSRLCDLRDRIVRDRGYATPVHVGCAGGISTPATVAAAFVGGAAYVLTGSVNQSCREALTSDAVKRLLCKVDGGGVGMAPAGDMFEMGARVQVLKARTLFVPRANKLADLYRRYESLDLLPAEDRTALEGQLFRRPLADVWADVERYLDTHHPEQADRGRRDARFRMGMVFRWYLLMSSRWAREGDPERAVDYQVWCGPAMGAFNGWAAGSFLEGPERRTVVQVARNLMAGGAAVLRARFLSLAGIALPPEAFAARPREFEE